MQIESGAINLDAGQIAVRSALQILHTLRRKSIGTAVHQLATIRPDA
jgi:hypothetical protein